MSKKGFWIEWAVAAVILLMILGFLLPAISAARGPARRMTCVSRLKQIAIALNVYHDRFGSLPPAYTVDQKGNRLHSWRVFLLPFMGEEALYKKIRLDEPWDSDYNRQFHRQSFSASWNPFLCPEIPFQSGYRKRNPPDTNGWCSYSAVIGPETPFPGAESVSFDDFSRGTSNTVLIVETAEPFCWMNPEADMTFGEAVAGVNKIPGGPGSFHWADGKTSGANIVRADGSVRFVNDEIASEVWRISLKRKNP